MLAMVSAEHRRTHAICVRMLWAENLLVDRQSTFIEWQRLLLRVRPSGSVTDGWAMGE